VTDFPVDLNSPSTRRTLLGGMLGALAGAALGAVGRPAAVLADGEAVKVGGVYGNSHTATELKNSANDNTVFMAVSTHGGYAVVGETAYGPAAVEGRQTGSGVIVSGTLGAGGTGVQAQSNGSEAINAVGLDQADGVLASTQHGTALIALGGAADSNALEVVGQASFSRSGVATIKSGKSQVVVDLDPVRAGTFAVATLQQYRAGVYVASAELSTAAKTLTIRLNKNVASATKVGWLAFES